MISLPEWFVVGVLTVICVLLGWGVKRLVKINDDTHKALQHINDNLQKINGRLTRSEMWIAAHDKQDDERHEDAQKEHDVLWNKIDKIHKVD